MKLEAMVSFTSQPLILPLSEGRVPAGFPSPADDHLEAPLDLNAYLVRNKAATFLMHVDGDSMQGAGILHGDLLVVDRSVEPKSGRIVVVALDGEYTVKRLRRTRDAVWLEPANPRYRSIQVQGDMHIFGVVVHAIHTLG